MEMHLLFLALKFSGPFTIREFPWHQSVIRGIRFIPPSTLSGFIRRILDSKMLKDDSFTPVYSDKGYQYYTLDYTKHLPLGAFVQHGKELSVHTAYRQGPRSFLHNRFSQLFDYGSAATKLALPDLAEYQPHMWDYMLVDEMIGYVLTKSLDEFDNIENYGCKIGKNGYAYIENKKVCSLNLNTKEDEIIPQPYDVESNVPQNIDRVILKCYSHLISNGVAYGFKNFAISFPKKPYKTRYVDADGIPISLSVIKELGGEAWLNALLEG
ncbi:MAG: hypothetical protein QXN36_07890 [Candidatus Bathyarchaeia archaeon]